MQPAPEVEWSVHIASAGASVLPFQWNVELYSKLL